ncbi:hypothetical protein [Sphingomonas phyllosphaerae]|uniref:hypothetical protein n=1 Tax=Sphingomonas phyllosphaerae TaxID=257003 RepID=UPI001E50A70A|nr:hypothetical protein [Sphingomonas phyllosphaerae]
MDYHSEAATLVRTNRTGAYEDLGPIRRSTCSTRPEPLKKPNVPPAIGRLIAELGLRYRPTAATDLAAHGEALRLLALDVADLPADRLERAISKWVRAERWMPRASDLVALCQEDQRRSFEQTYEPAAEHASSEAFACIRNAGALANRSNIEWYVDEAGNSGLRYKREPVSAIAPIHPDHVDAHNKTLVIKGATFRYDVEGYRRDLTPDEEAHRRRSGGGVMPWQR